jgi:hypothetical protein
MDIGRVSSPYITDDSVVRATFATNRRKQKAQNKIPENRLPSLSSSNPHSPVGSDHRAFLPESYNLFLTSSKLLLLVPRQLLLPDLRPPPVCPQLVAQVVMPYPLSTADGANRLGVIRSERHEGDHH